MKKINYFLTILVITMFLFISCNDTLNESNVYKKMSKNVKFDNINVSNYNGPIYLKGNIKGWKNKNDELVVYTETKKYKHIFVLQNSDDSIKMTKELENIEEIIFLDYGFLLKTSNEHSILVGLRDKEKSKEVKNILKMNFKSNNFLKLDGSGVVHMWISKNKKDIDERINYNTLLNEISVFDAMKVLADDAGVSCDSGGEGSGACSTGLKGSSCQVTCDIGYYACCNNGKLFTDATCKCIKIKDSSTE